MLQFNIWSVDGITVASDVKNAIKSNKVISTWWNKVLMLRKYANLDGLLELV